MADKRKIIVIDEDLCNGCGLCAEGCPEGAIQMIDGKARLVSEIYCDGLGACIGDCPVNAISIEERVAEAYDEFKTMDNIVKKGPNTIKAHLKHLLHHGETTYYNQALKYLKEHDIPVPDLISSEGGTMACGCPSTLEKKIDRSQSNSDSSNVNVGSQLSTWPVQLTLVSPMAGFFKNADLLIAADCTAFAYGNLHNKFLKGKVPVIFCPKLDSNINSYIDKLTMVFEQNNINSITILRMEVPCCGGTSKIVEEALKKSGKNIIIREYVIGINGEIL